MSDEIFIATFRQCQRCRGTGKFRHPLWSKLDSALLQWDKEHPFPEGESWPGDPQREIERDKFHDAFWLNEGYEGYGSGFVDANGLPERRLPPEQSTCEKCGGVGKERHFLTVYQFQKLLGIPLKIPEQD